MTGRATRLPITLNPSSPQAAGLVYWIPLYNQPIIPDQNSIVDLVGNAHGDFLHAEEMSHQVLDGFDCVWQNDSNAPCITPEDQLMSTPASWNRVGQVGMAAWVRPATLTPVDNDIRVIASSGAQANYTTGYILYFTRVSGVNYLRVGRLQAGYVFVGAQWAYGANMPLNAWYDVLGGHDGTHWRLYVNGVERASQADATGAGGLTGSTVPRIWALYVLGASAGGHWHGGYTDFRLYSQMPSAATAAAMYAPETRWDLYLSPGVTGNLSATLGGVTLNAAGKSVARGGLETTLGALTLSAAGTVTTPAPGAAHGNLSATLGALTLNAASRAVARGQLGATLGALSLQSAGTISTPGGGAAHGSLAATLGALSLQASGSAQSVTPTATARERIWAVEAERRTSGVQAEQRISGVQDDRI